MKDLIKSKNRRIAILAIILMTGILLRSNIYALPMHDEIIYFAASLQHAGVFGGGLINPEHPPLAKMMYSLSCSFQNCDRNAFIRYAYAYPLKEAYAPLALAVKSVLPGMRIVSILFSLATGIVIYYYSRKWFGEEAGIYAFALSMISPAILIYSSVVMLESAYIFFFISSFFFYLGSYREKRSLTHALILSVLLLGALLSRQILPLALLAIIGIAEFTDILTGKKVDGQTALILLSTYAISITIYPFNNLLAFHFFDLNSNALSAFLSPQFGLLEAIGTRLDWAITVPLILGVASLGIKKMHDRAQILGGSALLLLLLFLILPAYAQKLRYGIAIIPLIIPVSGYFFSKLSRWKKQLCMGACGLLLLHTVPVYPYFENYSAIPFIAPTNEERVPYFGVNHFLKEQGSELFITNDFYSLPYSFELNAEYALQMNENESCSIEKYDTVDHVRTHLETRGRTGIVYSKSLEEFPWNCPAVKEVVHRSTITYEDSYFVVYRLQEKE
ncbi:phospholipid carrier-dependent glycosyltransferase [Candidatus Micrarchaeota archaeon]|nr:phospholipid carrier-dependent glycosyltransferase [Candidatus Micrarchaeota archaeon]